MTYEQELKIMLKTDNDFMKYMDLVKSLDLKKWCIGAGVIRNIVWAHLHNIGSVNHEDIDVAYYDEHSTRDKEKD